MEGDTSFYVPDEFLDAFPKFQASKLEVTVVVWKVL